MTSETSPLPVLPKGTETSSFTNRRSTKIHTIHLPAQAQAAGDKPKGTFFFFHGLGDHSGRPGYCRLYESLSEKGMDVFALDHHGHGQSEGEPRMYCKTFDHYLDDIEDFVKEQWKGDTPLFLAGQSLGGLMAILTALRLGSDKVAGLVLTSPACGVEMDFEKKVQKFLSPVLTRLIPKAKLVDAVRAEDLTRDPAEIQAFLQDDLISKGKLCVRTGVEISNTFDTLPLLSEQIQCPLLILHGTADKCTSLVQSLAFFDKVGTAPVSKKLFVKLTGLYHEIYNEPAPERGACLDMITAFIASGGTEFPQGDVGDDRTMELDLIGKK